MKKVFHGKTFFLICSNLFWWSGGYIERKGDLVHIFCFYSKSFVFECQIHFNFGICHKAKDPVWGIWDNVYEVGCIVVLSEIPFCSLYHGEMFILYNFRTSC